MKNKLIYFVNTKKKHGKFQFFFGKFVVILLQGVLLCPQSLTQYRRTRLRRAFTEATSDTMHYVKTVFCYFFIFNFLRIFFRKTPVEYNKENCINAESTAKKFLIPFQRSFYFKYSLNYIQNQKKLNLFCTAFNISFIQITFIMLYN